MKKLIVLNFILSLLVLLILFLQIPKHYSLKDNDYNLFIISLTLLNNFLFLNVNKSILNNWINFNTFFTIGFFIVHFQVIFLDSLGIPPTDLPFVWINDSVVNYSTWLSCIAITFYVLFSLLFFLNRLNYKKISIPTTIIKTNKLDITIIILFIIFLISVGASFLSGNYDGGGNWGAGASYTLIMLRSCLIIRIVYFFYNYLVIKRELNFVKYLLNNKVFIVIVFLFLIVFLNAGDRGPIIEIGLIIIFLFSLFVKRISLGLLIFVIIGGSFLMTILREGRAIKDSNESIVSRGLDNIDQTSFFGFTEELAQSVRILFRATSIFPYNQDYLYGQTMIIDISSFVPFLSRYIIDNLSIPPEYTSSTRFFTIQGQGYSYTYGEGSEIIADIYINFGFLGVVLFFSIFGLFISKVSIITHKSYQFLPLIILVVYCSCSIYLNRSVFFYPLQLIFFTVLFDYIFRKKLQ